jgi:hypothetical protein
VTIILRYGLNAGRGAQAQRSFQQKFKLRLRPTNKSPGAANVGADEWRRGSGRLFVVLDRQRLALLPGPPEHENVRGDGLAKANG